VSETRKAEQLAGWLGVPVGEHQVGLQSIMQQNLRLAYSVSEPGEKPTLKPQAAADNCSSAGDCGWLHDTRWCCHTHPCAPWHPCMAIAQCWWQGAASQLL
jgi:hypothetical protein